MKRAPNGRRSLRCTHCMGRGWVDMHGYGAQPTASCWVCEGQGRVIMRKDEPGFSIQAARSRRKVTP
jgi:DnaJ-class molecular chaperone